MPDPGDNLMTLEELMAQIAGSAPQPELKEMTAEDMNTVVLDMDSNPQQNEDIAKQIKEDLANQLQNYDIQMNYLDVLHDDVTTTARVNNLTKTITVPVIPGMVGFELKVDALVSKLYEAIYANDHSEPELAFNVQSIFKVKVDFKLQHACKHFTSTTKPTERIKISDADVVIAEKYPFDILHPKMPVCTNEQVITINAEEGSSTLFTECSTVSGGSFQISCPFYEAEPLDDAFQLVYEIDGNTVTSTLEGTRIGFGTQFIRASDEIMDLAALDTANQFNSIAENTRTLTHMGYIGFAVDGATDRVVETFGREIELWMKSLNKFNPERNIKLVSFSKVEQLERGTFFDHVNRK